MTLAATMTVCGSPDEADAVALTFAVPIGAPRLKRYQLLGNLFAAVNGTGYRLNTWGGGRKNAYR